MVTLKDLAKEVNRSVTQVSRALAGCSDVSPKTIKIVREAADRLGYVPNVQARRLQKKSSDTIGIVAPVTSKGYAEPFFCEFLAGIGDAASVSGYDLLVAYSKKEENEIDVYKKLVKERKVDGFVLYRTYVDDARVNYLKSKDFPFVVFGQVENQTAYSFIDVDGDFAMQMLAEHLIMNGFTNIACICSSLKHTSALKRLNGMRNYLKERNIELLFVVSGCYDQKDGYNEAFKLLSEHQDINAFVCFNDMVAFGAINAAKDSGRVVGIDIAVTGFDDVQMSSYYRPPLTTIRQPIQEIGYKATEMLISQMKVKREDENSAYEQIILKPELIIRSSSGGSNGKN